MKNLPPITLSGDPKLLLMESIIIDAGLCCAVDLTKDISYVQSRFSSQREPFFYLVLPSLCDWFEQSLAKGSLCPRPEGFKGLRGTLAPIFLSSLTSQVFDLVSGEILASPCPNAILSFRQITRFFKKIEVAPRPGSDDDMVRKFVATDLIVGQHSIPMGHFRAYKTLCGSLFSPLFRSLYEKLDSGEARFAHGGGATSDHFRSNSKWTAPVYSRLGSGFFTDLIVDPSCPLGRGGFDLKESSNVGDESVKILTVPKTYKGPRIIAAEPTMTQFLQQGVMDSIYSFVDESPLNHAIGFRDQTRNQEKARLGSIGDDRGSLCTLDLSEASDRLSIPLVMGMIPTWPGLHEAFRDIRTSTAILPNGAVLPLRKYCAMGSAVCFPLETMSFYAICVLGTVRAHLDVFDDGVLSNVGCYLNSRSQSCEARAALVRSVYGKCVVDDFLNDLDAVSVFGDDIVVHSRCVDSVSSYLSLYGLKINQEKSFSTGNFRESCGGDFFSGTDVKPVYVRKELPNSISDGPTVIALVELSNNLYKAGWWITADLCRRFAEDLLGPLPLGDELSCLHLSYHQSWFPGFCRYNFDSHVFEFKGYIPKSKKTEDHINGYAALRKFLFGRRSVLIGTIDGCVNDDVLHQARSDVRYSTRLQRRWTKVS